MPNVIDKIIRYVSPASALKRENARRVLAYYEAAKSDRLRKNRREPGSGNTAVGRAGSSLRQQARHLEQNYDIALGTLNTLVYNIVGPAGIGIEPQPRRMDGSIHDDLARELLDLHKDWSRRPEVTWCHDWPATQRLAARTWLRDGEVLAQTIEGLNPWIDHGTRVPFSIELIEPDLVPMELSAAATGNARIVQGIEINAWGRIIAYHVLRDHPGELIAGFNSIGQTKRLSSDRVLHIATRHRIRQLRGVSVFASVLNRFDDLKDYEESERIAAKVAASMAAYIKKGAPEDYDPENGDQRHLKFRPGMIFDDLRPGEEIGMIDTNRPNPNLETYRGGQIKGIASGTGATASSIRKTYDGTYSAQRQEMVEAWSAYATLSNEFISSFVRPTWEKFVALAVLSGALRVPPDMKPGTLDDAIYIAPQMPWIDPKKEVEAWSAMEESAYISGPEIIRRRGGNPMDVLEQQARWLREKEARGVLPAKPEPAVVADPKPANEDDTLARALAVPLAAMTTGIQALSSREQVPIEVNVAAPVVTVGGSEIHNHLPEMQPTFEATVAPAAVTVENTVQAGPVHVAMPEHPAPVVHITNEITPAPIREIAIVSMPERITTTEIKRDADRNITNSTQTERDA